MVFLPISEKRTLKVHCAPDSGLVALSNAKEFKTMNRRDRNGYGTHHPSVDDDVPLEQCMFLFLSHCAFWLEGC